MSPFLDILKKKSSPTKKTGIRPIISGQEKLEKVAVRKGELGEYKFDLQLSQFPQPFKYISDLLIKHPKSISGNSQIDHLLISPYGIFVIEAKNYQGTIYGGILIIERAAVAAQTGVWLEKASNLCFSNIILLNYSYFLFI